MAGGLEGYWHGLKSQVPYPLEFYWECGPPTCQAVGAVKGRLQFSPQDLDMSVIVNGNIILPKK